MPLAPAQLPAAIDGLLSFPVTPFDDTGKTDLSRFAEHLARQIDAKPAAIFVCCGTGEYASLTTAEHADLVEVAVHEAAGRVPVLAGVGHSARSAADRARAAEAAGADGLVALPPYLHDGGQDGLVRYYTEVADATSLGIILYQRGNAVFEPSTVTRITAATPNVIGFKDGLGDIERLQRIKAVTDGQLAYFNGMPTAEVFVPAFAGMGVRAYSSAVFACAPEISTAFYRAFVTDDTARVQRLLAEFYLPFAELRRKVPGYAVALIKEALDIRGFPVGGVRAPLVDPTPEHRAALAQLLERGLAAAE